MAVKTQHESSTCSSGSACLVERYNNQPFTEGLISVLITCNSAIEINLHIRFDLTFWKCWLSLSRGFCVLSFFVCLFFLWALVLLFVQCCCVCLRWGVGGVREGSVFVLMDCLRWVTMVTELAVLIVGCSASLLISCPNTPKVVTD